LIDPQLVSEAYTQQQQVRGFYDFGPKLDVDRYTLADDKPQDYVVGVREIQRQRATTQQRNWLNRHTVFTHGYGMVAAPANQVVCGGLPYFVSGFLGDEQQPGCASRTEEIKVDQPRIYYGEQSPSTRSSGRPTRTSRSSSTGRSRTTTTPRSATPTTAAAACRSARSSAGWSSRSRTPRATSCSPTR
jgi:hypothetical protein